MNRRRWVLAVLALPLAYMGWVAWQVVADLDAGPAARSQPVSCKEAMGFADQSELPPGAHDAECEYRGARDTVYSVEFRITRTNLDAWLDSAYPDMKLESDCIGSPETVDACGHVDLVPYAEGGAAAVDLTVEYGKEGIALVRFQPFNT